MKKMVTVILAAAIVCGTGFAPVKADEGKIKIGLSFADLQSLRWVHTEWVMRSLIESEGAEAITIEAHNDYKLQNDQIQSLMLQGADAIIVVAEDGPSIAWVVDHPSKPHVPIIAYDRLIPSSKLAAYVSYDQYEVGRMQARGILVVKNSGRFILLGGSPTDPSAHRFRAGQMEILQPLIDQKRIIVVADQWVDNWDPDNAYKIMKNIITSGPFDAVVASNDGTALGALRALKEADLAGKIPISGQDATAEGCNSIVKGELTLTVYKDIDKLAPTVVDTAICLARHQPLVGLVKHPLSVLSLDTDLSGDVPCLFLDMINITKDNLYDVVVKSIFQTYDDVYSDIPAKKLPPRPAIYDPAFVEVLKKELVKRHITKVEDHFADGYFVALEYNDYFMMGDQIDLFALSALCRHIDRIKWPQVFANFFEENKISHGDLTMLESFDTARELLRVRILGRDMKDAPYDTSLSRENPLGWKETIVYDTPTATGKINALYLRKWGKTRDEVFRIAIDNTMAVVNTKFKPMTIQSSDVLYVFSSIIDLYVASGIFDLKRFGAPAGAFGTLVCIPNDQSIIAMPLVNKSGVSKQIDRFAQYAANLYHSGPGSITGDIFWYDGTKLYKLDHDPEKGRIMLPEALVKLIQ